MAQYDRVEQVEIEREEIEIDDQGRVVITNPKLADAIGAKLRGDELQVTGNFNCNCTPPPEETK